MQSRVRALVSSTQRDNGIRAAGPTLLASPVPLNGDTSGTPGSQFEGCDSSRTHSVLLGRFYRELRAAPASEDWQMRVEGPPYNGLGHYGARGNHRFCGASRGLPRRHSRIQRLLA